VDWSPRLGPLKQIQKTFDASPAIEAARPDPYPNQSQSHDPQQSVAPPNVLGAMYVIRCECCSAVLKFLALRPSSIKLPGSSLLLCSSRLCPIHSIGSAYSTAVFRLIALSGPTAVPHYLADLSIAHGCASLF